MDATAPEFLAHRIEVFAGKRDAAIRATKHSTDALRREVRKAVRGGLSQQQAAQLAGVEVSQIISWLGMTDPPPPGASMHPAGKKRAGGQVPVLRVIVGGAGT